ncbi:hypothetical protein [Streptomyces sp. NPDC059402]
MTRCAGRAREAAEAPAPWAAGEALLEPLDGETAGLPPGAGR